MKYRYTPNCAIVDYENMKKMFVFDENGEFETEDKKLIEWIKKNKGFLKPFEEQAEETALMECKKCPFETDNKGELMAHYRKEHPKK